MKKRGTKSAAAAAAPPAKQQHGSSVGAGANAMTQKDLAMIFSKLAEFEDKRTDDEFFLHISSDFSPEPSSTEEKRLEIEFQDLYNSLEGGDIQTREISLKTFFGNKIKSFQSSKVSLSQSILEARNVYKEKDLSTSDKLRLEQEIETFKTSSIDKSAECRDLQARFKEVEQNLASMSEEEQKKTDELQAKYEESVGNVWKHVKEEEDMILSKEAANLDLQQKIVQFKEHIKARREHLKTLRRSKDIEKQLSAARIAQHDALEQQRSLKTRTYNEHLAQLRATEADLVEQLQAYEEKAESFQKSIQDTGPVFKQFRDKAQSMEGDLQELNKLLEEKNVLLVGKQQKLDRFQQHTTALEAKLREAMEETASLDVLSKELQKRRIELQKEMKILEAGPPTSSSRNTSGGGVGLTTTIEGVSDAEDLRQEEQHQQEQQAALLTTGK